MRRILVAVDHSTCARCAFERAVELARELRPPSGAPVEIEVLHVLELDEYFDTIDPAERLNLRSPVKLRTFLGITEQDSIRISLELGDPASRILAHLEERGHDLLVMGTHGRWGASRLMMGSVAAEVIRLSLVPVLTVRAPDPIEPGSGRAPAPIASALPIRPARILCAVDFSSCSRAALAHALWLQQQLDGELLLLHVHSLDGSRGRGAERAHRQTEAQWQAFIGLLPPAVPERRRQLLVTGEPAREILRVATEQRCTLVVLGTHGRAGLSRMLIGSVAESVVEKAPMPVLTVREIDEPAPLVLTT